MPNQRVRGGELGQRAKGGYPRKKHTGGKRPIQTCESESKNAGPVVEQKRRPRTKKDLSKKMSRVGAIRVGIKSKKIGVKSVA